MTSPQNRPEPSNGSKVSKFKREMARRTRSASRSLFLDSSLMHIGIRDGQVATGAEVLYHHARGRAVDVPIAVRRTEHSSVETAVAVVIARHRYVARGPERER